MTREEAKSCICTIKMLQRLAYNIHGVIDVIDADNCKKIIKALEQEPRWIPVSERMPNFNDIVLASTDSNYDELKVIITVCGGEAFWFNGRIKAWMPLPAPYKAERSDKE